MEEEPEDLLPGEAAAQERAFGADSRRRILSGYLAEAGSVTSENAWKHVYRLLLWINPTIGLAHCYESDKCQPHKAWYPRSLAFHAWVSDELDVDPAELREEIDQLFSAAFPRLAKVEAEARLQAAEKHLKPYHGQHMPLPGDDDDLVELIAEALSLESISIRPEQAQRLVEQVYTHFSMENKRKNLLGRGFEDTLAALIDRLGGGDGWEVRTRATLGEIPQFRQADEEDKRIEVDLALWERKPRGRRLLVSSKWSVRADREEQFRTDQENYVRHNGRAPFEYYLVTNEFDAARLHASASMIASNQHLFDSIVHVQPAAVMVAYGDKTRPPKPTAKRVESSRLLRGHLEAGRIVSLETWLVQTLGL